MLAVAIAAGPFFAVSAASADKRGQDHIDARELLRRGEILPLSRILQIVQEKAPGDVIEVELDHSDKHGWEYEVKVLAANGRVLEVKLDARTGTIRKIEDD
ncbi:PepSY domain-containing protein [Pseudoxanthomonas sangjuensis]